MSERRENMVEDQLRHRGISDETVLEAFRTVPREEFVRPEDREQAYDDRALPTEDGQTISQPYMVARMTQSLECSPGDRVLEVGTGSGYQAAILAEMGIRVFGVEYKQSLVDTAWERLQRLGYGDLVTLTQGDGSTGWAEYTPYDGILVTAAAPEVPESLKQQLADPGTMVLPVGSRRAQELKKIRKTGGQWTSEDLVSCVFVPLMGEEGWDESDR